MTEILNRSADETEALLLFYAPAAFVSIGTPEYPAGTVASGQQNHWGGWELSLPGGTTLTLPRPEEAGWVRPVERRERIAAVATLTGEDGWRTPDGQLHAWVRDGEVVWEDLGRR